MTFIMIILVHPAPSTLVVIVIRPGTHRCILCVDEFTATQAAGVAICLIVQCRISTGEPPKEQR